MPAGYSRVPQDAPYPAPESAYAPTSSSSPPLTPSDPFFTTAPPQRSLDPFRYPPPRRISLGASKKGKGKAVDDVGVAGGESGAGPTGLCFCVRFTDGQTDDLVDLWVGEKDSVREVKRRIRLLRPQTLHTSEEDGSRPRRLRLIQLGRLLPDGVFLVPYTVQLNSRRAALVTATEENSSTKAVKEGLEAVGRGIGAVVREVRKAGEGEKDEMDSMEKGESSKGKGKEREGAADRVEEDDRIWLHCSVGDAEEEEPPTEEKSDEKVQTSQLTPLQGFDRLREAGFSDEDIDNLRAEFRERRGIDGDEEDEDDTEHQRAVEEQWMSGMTGQEEAGADASTSGHYYSLLKGVCVGFFVPFLPLFFFRSQIFSKRMQMAIVLGIVFNLVFGVLRLLG
ncbi:hypothetical protein JCM11641_004545 [Rhodosporidiobolus odoratus]